MKNDVTWIHEPLHETLPRHFFFTPIRKSLTWCSLPQKLINPRKSRNNQKRAGSKNTYSLKLYSTTDKFYKLSHKLRTSFKHSWWWILHIGWNFKCPYKCRKFSKTGNFDLNTLTIYLRYMYFSSLSNLM